MGERRPSDRALALAFWEARKASDETAIDQRTRADGLISQWGNTVVARARIFDAHFDELAAKPAERALDSRRGQPEARSTGEVAPGSVANPEDDGTW